MAYHPEGVKFVLTAPDTESTEQAFSPWKQMMYASAPAQFVPRFFYKSRFDQPRNEDCSAKVMTYGVRLAEEVLRRAYPDDDVVVCYPDDLDAFVGRRTVAVGVGAHNPIGTAFSTGVYSNIFGSSARPINAAESERVYLHPAIRKHKPKVVVGGAGAWQIDKTGSRERLGIDCIINGRAESRILEVFQMAEDGRNDQRATAVHREPGHPSETLHLQHCRDAPRLRPTVRILLADTRNSDFRADAERPVGGEGQHLQWRAHHFPSLRGRLHLRGFRSALHPQTSQPWGEVATSLLAA